MEAKANGATNDLIDRLDGMPKRLMKALSVTGVTELQLRRSSEPDAWSAHDILTHLRAADDIVAPRVYMLLTRDQAPLTAFDERAWALVAGYSFRRGRDLVRTYALRRAELVAALRRAADDDWPRAGAHEERGVVTLFDIVRSLVEHEEEHVAQFERQVTASAPLPAGRGRTSAAGR